MFWKFARGSEEVRKLGPSEEQLRKTTPLTLEELCFGNLTSVPPGRTDGRERGEIAQPRTSHNRVI